MCPLGSGGQELDTKLIPGASSEVGREGPSQAPLQLPAVFSELRGLASTLPWSPSCFFVFEVKVIQLCSLFVTL